MDATDSMFWTNFYTLLSAFLLTLTGLIFKSKCKKVQLCGICEIQRDVDL